MSLSDLLHTCAAKPCGIDGFGCVASTSVGTAASSHHLPRPQPLVCPWRCHGRSSPAA